ncbi:MAG: CDP-glucose 4,6-dehydratase [Bacteroidales bacterium]|nr:CDP-glucose 4,6-dehydratase [Bacteroidales bacterium]
MKAFDDFFRGKRVLVTGHTGFKGSWLSLWLQELGAVVAGVALDPLTERDNYVLSGIGQKLVQDIRADIRDAETVKALFAAFRPEIVFHLAAQPIVRLSYAMPVETYQTNVLGTIHVLEAIRATDSVRVAVMVTTDKCYENREQLCGYKEDDPLGGYDPYSSSKAACEIAIQSWRRSFFNPADYGTRHQVSLASVRAGNVIGGGDWAKDRIIPDCVRALEAGESIGIRNPKAVRPWQHVLEPLSGYLLLASKMWDEPTRYCEGWNFGPDEASVSTVWDVASMFVDAFGYGSLKDISRPSDLHEAGLLMLDISKARNRLGWQPRLDVSGSVALTAAWYKRYRQEDVYRLCRQQIEEYLASE